MKESKSVVNTLPNGMKVIIDKDSDPRNVKMFTEVANEIWGEKNG